MNELEKWIKKCISDLREQVSDIKNEDNANKGLTNFSFDCGLITGLSIAADKLDMILTYLHSKEKGL